MEDLRNKWRGKVCLFGAGRIGRGLGYRLIKCFGFNVDFYCDNNTKPGTEVVDDIRVKDIRYLYDNKDDVLVFVTVGYPYHESIIKQLREHGIDNVIIADHIMFSELMDSIDKSGDEAIKQRYFELYDDEKFLKSVFKEKTGYSLDLDNPKSFNEKMQWLKLYDRNTDYIKMVDKYEAKKYIEDTIGSEYVIPNLGVYASTDEIDFEKLPEKFVLKCTHDSGGVILCKNKELLDFGKTKSFLDNGMKTNYYWYSREFPYKNIKPRIIAETYMMDAENTIDYKFMCFHGKVRMIFTCSERHSKDGLKVTFFDTEWNKLPFERHYPSSKKEIARPQNLQLMIELAEELSKEIPFVRVDFYEVNGKVYFGELTFYPGSGWEEFTPLEWDYKLGEWLEVP
jgi:hypothetical protein